MERFLAFIKTVSERPGMFVGSPNLQLLEIYLGGYESALAELDLLEDKFSTKAFTEWLRIENEKSGSWWDVILLERYGSDEIAISELPKKYAEFIAHVKLNG